MSTLAILVQLSPFQLTNRANPRTTNISIPTTPSFLIPQATLSSSPSSHLWTISEIVEAVNGRIIRWGPPGTISTDTRTLESGQWFLPLVGQNFDAHNFISLELATKGCVGVIGNWVCEDWEKGFVELEGDNLNSLKKLGIYARNRFNGCLIGLTGSVGKTTTKTMIALALESIGTVYHSPGNLNNEIGVPLSLIGMPRDVGFGVFEMGMSKEREILELSRMCRPDIRVILNVSAAHLENFENLEEVSMAKGEILRDAMPGDVCVLNADDPLVMSLPVPKGVKKVLFGRKMGCDVRLVSSQIIDGGHRVQIILEAFREMVEFVISSPGLHLAVNACAAAAVASALGVPLAPAGKSLSRFKPVHRRSELEVAENGITIINDVYNASPAITQAAIDLLRGIDCKKGQRVAILGDMLELGPREIKFHELMLQHCGDARFDVVVLVGARFLRAAENLNIGKEMKLVCATDARGLTSEIVNHLNRCDVVLVKGSRGMGMEVIVDAIKSIDFRNHSVMSNI